MLSHRYNREYDNHPNIESNLTECLTECINNEIVLRSITNATGLFQWIKGTFYYIRVHKNPQHYHIVPNPDRITAAQQHEYIDEQLQILLNHYITQLKDHGMIHTMC